MKKRTAIDARRDRLERSIERLKAHIRRSRNGRSTLAWWLWLAGYDAQSIAAHLGVSRSRALAIKDRGRSLTQRRQPPFVREWIAQWEQTIRAEEEQREKRLRDEAARTPSTQRFREAAWCQLRQLRVDRFASFEIISRRDGSASVYRYRT